MNVITVSSDWVSDFWDAWIKLRNIHFFLILKLVLVGCLVGLNYILYVGIGDISVPFVVLSILVSLPFCFFVDKLFFSIYLGALRSQNKESEVCISLEENGVTIIKNVNNRFGITSDRVFDKVKDLTYQEYCIHAIGEEVVTLSSGKRNISFKKSQLNANFLEQLRSVCLKRGRHYYGATIIDYE